MKGLKILLILHRDWPNLPIWQWWTCSRALACRRRGSSGSGRPASACRLADGAPSGPAPWSSLEENQSGPADSTAWRTFWAIFNFYLLEETISEGRSCHDGGRVRNERSCVFVAWPGGHLGHAREDAQQNWMTVYIIFIHSGAGKMAQREADPGWCLGEVVGRSQDAGTIIYYKACFSSEKTNDSGTRKKLNLKNQF